MSVSTHASLDLETFETAQDPELALDKVVAMLSRQLDRGALDNRALSQPG
jgi:ribosome-associated translation inhibitor RaiA